MAEIQTTQLEIIKISNLTEATSLDESDYSLLVQNGITKKAKGNLFKGRTGDVGAKGEDGITPNITVGTVSTLSANESASASITGTNENPILNLGIPKGADASDTLPLDGVFWLNFGDSLSSYSGSEFGYSNPTTWCQKDAKLSGATIKNCAVGGAGLGSINELMTQTNTTTTDIANAQIITIMLYGNDLLEGLPAGTYTDTASLTGNSCCARLKGLVNYIQTYNKTAPIIFIQEPMRLDGFGANSWAYATELRKTCNYLQIPYFDLAKCCGFNENTYDTYYHTDKLHLKPVGYERLAGLNSKAVCSFFVVTS